MTFNASMKIKLIEVKSHSKKTPCIANDETDVLSDSSFQRIMCKKRK